MQDKIYMLVEAILQETRAAREDVANIKKDMITHEVFQHHVDSMTTQLDSISNEQIQQKKNIFELGNKINKGKNTLQAFTAKQNNKVAGIIFVIIFSILGLFVPHIVVNDAASHHVVQNIITNSHK